jgi:hypothetical protein
MENDKDQERRDMSDDNTQGGAEPSGAFAGSHREPVAWDQHGPQWFVAWRHGKPISAFRFETMEVNRKRSWDDGLKNPVGLWLAWVPGENESRLITWPDGTDVDQMKADLIAADVRLHQ